MNGLYGRRFEPLRNSLEEWELKFFREFDDFADVLNWYLADDTISSPWRLQELSDTDVGTAETGPISGRTYAVFYNQTQLGRLEIHGDVFYGKEERTIATRLELNWVRLLSYHHLVEFLYGLAAHVVDATPQTGEYAAATHAISAAMLKALWDSYHISRFDPAGNDLDWGELELHLRGTPKWYFLRRDCQAFAELKRARKIAA